MSINDTIEAIKDLPDEGEFKGEFEHRTYYNQADWDDKYICSYADLKELAASYTELATQARTFIKQCEIESTEDELKGDSVYQSFLRQLN